MALLARAEVWSNYECADGVRLAVFREVLECEGRESLDGNDRVTVVTPATDQAVAVLRTRRVLRLVFSDATFTEWRIQDDGREQAEGGRVTVVAVSPLFDLADATVISETQSSGVVDFDIGLSQVTLTEVIDDYIIAKLPAEYDYFARGTVDPTAKYDVVFERATPLALLRTLCDLARDPTTKRPAELRVRRNGTTGYYIDVVTEVNGDAAIPDLRARKNLRRLSYTRSAQQQATVVYPFGATDADGVSSTVARAAWTLTLASGTTYEITDPEGGPSPVLEDDQLNGCYVVPDGTNPLVQITDSAAGSPATVTLASSTGITSGRQYELRADSAGTLVTSVASPSAITTYGTKVGTVERGDLVGIRNLVRRPWFRTWTAGVPDGWTVVLNPSQLTQNTDALYTDYGGSSVKIASSGPRTTFYSDPIYPRAVTGAQFFTLTARVFFKAFSGSSTFTLQLYTGNVSTQIPGASVIVVPPDFPTVTTSPAVAAGSWQTLTVQGIDLGAYNSSGVAVFISATGVGMEVYVDAVQLEVGLTPAGRWVEYSAANALWAAGVLALQLNRDPVATYEVECDDLERAGESVYDELLIGAYARINESALGVANTLVRIVEKPLIDYLTPKRTTLTLATKTKLLSEFLLSGSAGTTTVSVSGGGGGSGTGTPPGGGSTPGSPAPPPPTAIAQAPTRWEIRAQGGSQCLIPDVPAAVTEVDVRLRRYVQIGEKHNLTGRVVTAGNSGSYLRVEYFRTSDSTWRALDGTSGPQLSLTSTGDIIGSLVTTEADARGLQLCRLVSVGGDAAADPAFGSLALIGAVVSASGTPPVDIPWTPSAFAYWALTEGSGQTVANKVAEGPTRDLVLGNSTGADTYDTTWAAGPRRMQCPALPSFEHTYCRYVFSAGEAAALQNGFAIFMPMYLNSGPGDKSVFGIVNPSGGRVAWFFYDNTAGRVPSARIGGSGTAVGTTPMANGAWHQVGLIYTGTRVKCVVNGVVEGDVAAATIPTTATGTYIDFGWPGTNLSFAQGPDSMDFGDPLLFVAPGIDFTDAELLAMHAWFKLTYPDLP